MAAQPRVHFMLTHNGKTHRFGSAFSDRELFWGVRTKVASIVNKESYNIVWNNGDSNVVLETVEDIIAAIDCATRKSPTETPWVQLYVKPKRVDTFDVLLQIKENLTQLFDYVPEQEWTAQVGSMMQHLFSSHPQQMHKLSEICTTTVLQRGENQSRETTENDQRGRAIRVITRRQQRRDQSQAGPRDTPHQIEGASNTLSHLIKSRLPHIHTRVKKCIDLSTARGFNVVHGLQIFLAMEISKLQQEQETNFNIYDQLSGSAAKEYFKEEICRADCRLAEANYLNEKLAKLSSLCTSSVFDQLRCLHSDLLSGRPLKM